jgi:hypothetical protein
MEKIFKSYGDIWDLIIEDVIIPLIPYATTTNDKNLHEEWK